MSTIEKLFVQIFDRKRRIGEQLDHQKQLYEQHLASKLLIQGITPPPWLLQSEGFASSSNPSDLNKEDLIHDLLLPRPKQPASYPNASHLYQLFPTATRDELQYDLFNASSALCKGFDDSRPGVLPQCLFKGQKDTHDHVAESPLDRATPADDAGFDQSLARIQRSRSRQKALEIRSSRKSSSKRRLEDNQPTVTAEQEMPIQRIAAVDRNLSPAHMSLAEEDSSCREVEAFRHSIKQMDASTQCRSSPSDCHRLSTVESLVAPDSEPRSGREFSKPVAHEPDVERHSEDNLPTVTAGQDMLIQGSEAADRNLSSTTHNSVAERQRTSSKEAEVLSHTIKKMDASTICLSPPGNCQNLSMEESEVVNGPLERCVEDEDKLFEANKILEPLSVQVTPDASLGSPPLKDDDLPSNGAKFSGEFNGPCVSPGGKTVNGVAASSGGSSNRGISSPELACFQIDESGEEDGNADVSDHICSEETGSLRSSLLCASIDKKKSRQKALEIRSSRKSSSKRRLEDNQPTVTAEQEMPIQRIAAVDRNLSPAHMSLAEEDSSCREVEAFRHSIKQMDASTQCRSSPSDCHRLSTVESLVAPDSEPRSGREFSKPVAHEPDVERHSEDNLPTVTAGQDMLIQGSEAADRNLSSTTHNSVAKRQRTLSKEAEAFSHTIKKMDASTICLSPPGNCQNLSVEESEVVNGPLERCVGDEAKLFEANKILESLSVQVTPDASLGSPPLKDDDLPSNGAKFSGELNGPRVSPGGKTVNGVAASSGGSSNRGISSPELACFQIDESSEEDGNADGSDHICSEETGSLRSSLLCASIDKKKSIDSALNTASLGSHCTEIFLSDSDWQMSSNAVLGCFPVGRGIEQDLNGVEALKTCQEETDCIEQPLCDISNNMVPTIDSSPNKASAPPSDYQNFSTEESLAVPDCVFSSQMEVSEGFADEPDTMIDVACDGKSPRYNPIIEDLIENQSLRFKEEEISRSCPDESDTSIEMGATYIAQKDESSYDPCSLLSAGQTVAVIGPLESYVGDDFKSSETNGILGSSSFQVTQDASLGSQPLEADDIPSIGARFSWELKVPCVSPGRKSIDGLTARSGGSSSRGSSNPEFACFPIDECVEEDDDDADDAAHICSEETGLLRDSLHSLSEDKEKGIDSASNTASLGSYNTEISLRRSNAELDCFPAGRGNEQDLHGLEALKACQEETGCIRQPLYNISNSMVPAIGSLSSIALESFCRSSGTSELNDKTSQKSQDYPCQSGRLSQQKQSQNFSLSTSGIKKRSDSLKTRFSKPKASAKTSMEIRSVGLSEKEPMRKNIVSSMSSFLPLVQQKQAAACAPVKKEVKVKALEVAEAAKRLAEKKENERKHKKEALKLERARMEQENLRRLEMVKKAKEAEKKKKDAEIAARKRQREEDERKEKERKKKRVGEARTQQKGNAVQISVDKAECRFQAEDGKTNRRNEGNAVTGKTMDVEQNDERAGTSLANNLAVSSSDKALDSKTASCSTPKPDQNNSSASQEIREKSYEISPYCCSDEEDEGEDDLSNSKFIPSWASKSNLRLALSFSNALDPSIVFPLKSFCSLNEVLLPRELQRR